MKRRHCFFIPAAAIVLLLASPRDGVPQENEVPPAELSPRDAALAELAQVTDTSLGGYERTLKFPPYKIMDVSVYSAGADGFLSKSKIQESVEKVKELGATHVGTTIEFRWVNEKVALWVEPAEPPTTWLKRLVTLVNAAHEAGLGVYLGLMVSPLNAEDVQLDSFFESFLPFIERWARFAERYQIERFLLLGRSTGLRAVRDNPPRASEGFAQCLAAARELYKGKVGIGLFQSSLGDAFKVKGFDFFEVVLPPAGQAGSAFDAYVSSLNGQMQQFSELCAKNRVGEFVVSPLGLVTERDQRLGAAAGKIAPSNVFRWGTEEEEKRFYEEFLPVIREHASGVRLTYLGPVFSFAGEPAEAVISKQVKKWKT